MKLPKLFLILLLLLPAFLPAQVFDQDSVFILERKTLELGKTISGRNKDAWKGFTWRISTGYMSRSYGDEFYSSTAAVIPLSLEFGYKFYFVELGFRHSRTGIALGTDFSYTYGPVSNTVRASYPIPANLGINTNLGVVTLHTTVGKIPLFFNAGIGRSDFTFSNKSIVQQYNTDGTSDYVVNRNVTGLPHIKTLASMFGLGFSKGPFFGGIEWCRRSEKKDIYGYRPKDNYQNMYFGLQMTTAKTKAKSPNPRSRKDHVQIGLSKIGMLAPWRNSGTGSGWTADMAVKINRRMQIAGSFQFTHKKYGFEKYIPEDDKLFGFPLSNTAGNLKRHLLYAGYALNPNQLFRIYTYAGLGFYQNKNLNTYFDYPQYPTDFNSGGVVIGTGFQYKYIHSLCFSTIPSPIIRW